jgi:hypothetical protein
VKFPLLKGSYVLGKTKETCDSVSRVCKQKFQKSTMFNMSWDPVFLLTSRMTTGFKPTELVNDISLALINNNNNEWLQRLTMLFPKPLVQYGSISAQKLL